MASCWFCEKRSGDPLVEVSLARATQPFSTGTYQTKSPSHVKVTIPICSECVGIQRWLKKTSKIQIFTPVITGCILYILLCVLFIKKSMSSGELIVWLVSLAVLSMGSIGIIGFKLYRSIYKNKFPDELFGDSRNKMYEWKSIPKHPEVEKFLHKGYNIISIELGKKKLNEYDKPVKKQSNVQRKRIPDEKEAVLAQQSTTQKEKISTTSKIPGLWECIYSDKGPSPSHLLKIKRRANEVQFLDVDRWSLREKKDPQEKHYDIHLHANGIKWKYSREKPKAWQASVEMHLINKNTLKGTFEDTDGIADYEMRRMSESNDYGRTEVEDKVPDFVRSDGYNKRGRDLDNAGKIDGAIREYTKAIQLTNNTLAYYNRACLYKDQRKFKEAIEDFRSYLKYGPANTPQGYSCQAAIEELEKKLKPASQPKGEKSNVLCPTCKCNLFIAEKDVDGVEGILKLECPECGQTTVKL